VVSAVFAVFPFVFALVFAFVFAVVFAVGGFVVLWFYGFMVYLSDNSLQVSCLLDSFQGHAG
jgi:hypothetical protein